MDDESYLSHIGTPRHSGRYPWGSGGQPYQSGGGLIARVNELKAQGLTEAKIAASMGMTTTTLRAKLTISKNDIRKENIATAVKLKEKGMSTLAIGKQMGVNESTVRGWLNPSSKDKADVLQSTVDTLKEAVDQGKYIDVGTGVELYMGVKRTKLDTAVAELKEMGYSINYVKVDQAGSNQTTIKVLSPPGTKTSEVHANLDKISNVGYYSEDGGHTFSKPGPPVHVKGDRVKIRYNEEGGIEKDGVIEIRPGVDDVSLGNSRYAQVRIGVNGTHYLKGMAMYGDPKDFPPGVDLLFNTNKKKGTSKEDVLKPMKDDADLPFGAVVRQKKYIDKNGKEHQSSINIVNEEGTWNTWSKNLPSQFLSKQSVNLAKEQLGKAYSKAKSEFDEINSLTNPVVRKKLLKSFSDELDSKSVHLKGAAMPRQRTQVILPIPKMKETEIYAPNFKNGERVVLVRFPHGGIFELPELTVNNRQRDAKRALGDALDAVGISSKVAERLSGADFDGDTVLVIPNGSGKVKVSKALAGLKDFDPSSRYSNPPGVPKVGTKGNPYNKQMQMGITTNLITDMQIKGANQDEIARAVRHSMVVIDAEKHNLNWKQSAIDNNVSALKQKYQGKATGGASTLVSRASAEARVPSRKPRSAKDGGSIDPKTGKKVYTPTGDRYIIDKKTGKPRNVYDDPRGSSAKYAPSGEKYVYSTTKSTKMAETDNAFSLSSGTAMESVYATHANQLKALANTARKSYVSAPKFKYSPTAKKTYAKEVSELNASLNVALKNSPLERQALAIANSRIKAKRKANPDMTKDDLKKLKTYEMNIARSQVGASKSSRNIQITPKQWEAIQAGAVSESKLTSIINNADEKLIKQLATPKPKQQLSLGKEARITAMIKNGLPASEIADSLGVSVSTVLDRKGSAS